MLEVLEFCFERIEEDSFVCRYQLQRETSDPWKAFHRLDLEEPLRRSVEDVTSNPGLEALRLGQLGATITLAELLDHQGRWAILTRIAERWWRHPDHQDAWSLSGMRGWEARMDELRSKNDNSE